MDRAVAIGVAKRLFIESACKMPSVSAALATVLFDQAANAPETPGFTRSEIATAVSTLTEEWGIGETFDDAVHRELGRFPEKLQAFSEKHLPYLGVTSISGPTGIARGDQGGLLFLKIDYVPQATEAAGALASAFERAVTEVIGEDARLGYDRDVAAGTAHVVATTPVRNPTARGVLVTVLIGFTAALSLLAYPTSRRWIVTRFQALIRKDGAPRSAGSTISVLPDPHYTLQNVRVKNRETLLFSSIQSTSIDGHCEHGKPVVVLNLGDIPAMKELVLLRNDEIYKRYPNFRGGVLNVRDEAVQATHSYVYKVAQRDGQRGDFVTSTPRSAYVPRCPSGNRTPIGQSMSVEPRQGTAPVTVHCSITAIDPDGDPLTYSWSFMDYNGFTYEHGATAQHTFLYSGKYAADAYADDGRDEPQKVGGAEIVVEGPPPPLISSAEYRRAMGFGIVIPVSGPVGSPFTIRVYREMNERGAHVVQYRFRLGYCNHPVKVRNPPMPCITDPQASPEFVHTYKEPGQYEIEVELTYDDGEMDVKPLAIVNVTAAQ